MQLSFQSAATASDNSYIVPVIFDKKMPAITAYPSSLQKIIRARIKSEDFESKTGSVFETACDLPRFPKHLVLVSLGDSEKLKEGIVRSHIAGAIKLARGKQKREVALYIPEALHPYAELIGETVVMANHFMPRYKTGKDLEQEKKKLITALRIVTSERAKIEPQLKTGITIGEAVNQTRDFINDPPNILTPRTFSDYAKRMAKEQGYRYTIFEKKELEKMGMGAILAVNRGSTNEEDNARLVVLEYMPNKNERPIALVGKGIIFDTGGYDLKPSKHMADMQMDMSGAAVVFGVFSLLKKLGIKRNIVGIAPLTANLVGPTAYKSSEIIKTYSGKTVEVTNTDAEGRMVLCDAISYANKIYKPKSIIDIATLTGACTVALGDRYAGMMGTDEEAMKKLSTAGETTDDLVWPLPIHPDWEEKMKSKIADLHNTEEGYYAGAQKGAAFLKFFVEKTPWVHLDIAGPAFTHDPKKYESPRGTGFGVRLLTTYLKGEQV